jgi:acetyl-CoA carboxylase / biotin carboxylase 1
MWVDPNNTSKGIKYLYLSEKSYLELNNETGRESVQCEKLEYEGQVIYKINAVIGKVDGLGVENLRGSGMTAGETSRAYDEVFTLTLVTCRSVGIGAYLARLGQRVVQVEYTPILLTGAAPLNKLLGREVYTSNLQLGYSHYIYLLISQCLK